jgi:hypothetical protein
MITQYTLAIRFFEDSPYFILSKNGQLAVILDVAERLYQLLADSTSAQHVVFFGSAITHNCDTEIILPMLLDLRDSPKNLPAFPSG